MTLKFTDPFTSHVSLRTLLALASLSFYRSMAFFMSTTTTNYGPSPPRGALQIGDLLIRLIYTYGTNAFATRFTIDFRIASTLSYRHFIPRTRNGKNSSKADFRHQHWLPTKWSIFRLDHLLNHFLNQQILRFTLQKPATFATLHPRFFDADICQAFQITKTNRTLVKMAA